MRRPAVSNATTERRRRETWGTTSATGRRPRPAADRIDPDATVLRSFNSAVQVRTKEDAVVDQPLQEPERCGSPFLVTTDERRCPRAQGLEAAQHPALANNPPCRPDVLAPAIGRPPRSPPARRAPPARRGPHVTTAEQEPGRAAAGEGPAGGVRLFLRAIKKKGGVWPSLIASTCGL